MGGNYSNTSKSCFKQISTGVSWAAAHTTCRNASAMGLRGRLAQPKTEAAYNLVLSIAVGNIWLALKTLVLESQNVSDWLWYENATTPTSCFSAAYMPSDLWFMRSGFDCGYMHIDSNRNWDGIYDNNCNGSATYPTTAAMCEFLTGIFFNRIILCQYTLYSLLRDFRPGSCSIKLRPWLSSASRLYPKYYTSDDDLYKL